MLRGSPNHKQVCGVNAEICREVAEECEKFDDDVMSQVTEKARACAESCERMAG